MKRYGRHPRPGGGVSPDRRDLSPQAGTLGRQRAELYVGGLFEAFGRIEAHAVSLRPVPAEFGVDGYVFHHERHFIYWRRLDNGGIGIVTVLPERMHRMDRFREDSRF